MTGVWCKSLLALLCLAYPWLVHAIVTKQLDLGPAGLVLAAAPLLALGYWAVARARSRLARIVGCVLLAAVAFLLYARASAHHSEVAVAYGIPHTIAYLFLLWFFGRTLLDGREPLITRLARRVHGSLTPALGAYTRSVTISWCAFFAGQLLLSGLMLWFGTLYAWSLFINVLNVPLLALMFVAEYGYRRLRHPEFPHASITTAVTAFTQDAALAKRERAR